MIPENIKIYLASKSPRRRFLLSLLTKNFESFSVDLDEVFDEAEDPVEVVKRLSLHKMEAALNLKDTGIIITADTIVVLDGRILGKPVDDEDAFRILSTLSNRQHTVYTGYMISNRDNGKEITDFVKTDVFFRKLEPEEINAYIKGGSPMDKAGAYGIQDDFGAVFVNRIEGCYYNVVGFPLSAIYNSIREVL